MDFKELRQTLLKVFVCFLILTAVFSIVSVLIGEFGEFQVKALVTTLTISAASICAMACAAFIEKQKMHGVGVTGIALSVMSAALIIAGLWLEAGSGDYWKMTASVGIAAAAFAHVFLLVLPDLDAKHRWIQQVSTCSIALLALLIILAVIAENLDEGYFRLLAALAIIVGLETLVIPILMKLRKRGKQVLDKLILERIDGELFTDSAGKIYKVTKADPEAGG